MPKFCSECGSELREIGDFRPHWFSVYECESGAPLHDFIRIADSKHVFPLLQLSLGVKERLVGAEQSLVTLAASRIQTIDHKTVSIVQFEHTLLGCYKKPSPFGAAPYILTMRSYKSAWSKLPARSPPRPRSPLSLGVGHPA